MMAKQEVPGTVKLSDMTDEDLQQIADDSVSSVKRFEEVTKRGAFGVLAGDDADKTLRRLKEMRDEARGARDDLNDAAREIEQLQRRFFEAEAELAEKTTALRQVDRDASTRRFERAVADARAEETARSAAEIERLRGVVVRQESEIIELRASKKKLREALDRAREGR